MEKIEYRVVNVVVSSHLPSRVDLTELAWKDSSAEYSEKFPGIVYRLKNPKITTLIFSSGKMIGSGSKSVEEAKKGMVKIAERIYGKNFNLDVKVHNIVASGNFNMNVDLENLDKLSTLYRWLYEPEQFSAGIVWPLDEDKPCSLIYENGKFNVVGAKSMEELERWIDKLYHNLHTLGLFLLKNPRKSMT